MPTLVISSRGTPDNLALWQEARRLAWPVHMASGTQVPLGLEDPIVYGTLPFCDAVAPKLGIELIDPDNDWLARLPEEYLSRKVEFCALHELGKFPSRVFVKPANDKVFPASVYERGSEVPRRFIDPWCPILVSDVVDFDVEIRCYVKDRVLRTAATYQWKGAVYDTQKEKPTLEEACLWVSKLLEDTRVPLPPAVVIDVGRIPGVGWAVVEANQAYASGVYSEADPAQVLSVLEQASGPRAKFTGWDANGWGHGWHFRKPLAPLASI